MDEYIRMLREWEVGTALPLVYENIDRLFPEFQFRRINAGTSKDHWASRYKLDGSVPKVRNSEKTVVYRSDMRFREQGEWDSPITVIDAVIKREGLSTVYDFDVFVSGMFNIPMPRTDSVEVKRAAAKHVVRRKILEELVDYFVWNLKYNRAPKAGAVRNYLKSVRKFTPESIEQFQFGFVPSWEKVVSYITVKKKFPKEEFDAVCQVYNDEGRTMVGKTHTLSIPYICGGVIKGFLFRRIDGDSYPKYIVNTGLDRKSTFFNIREHAEDIIIVEGEMDALTVTAAGVSNAVAIGGAEVSGERRKQIEDAFRRGVRKITLCFDLDCMVDVPDRPNRAARHNHIMKTIHTIKDVDISFDEIYVASFDTVCDPDEFIREHGSDAFIDFLKRAVPYWKYAYDYYNGSHLKTPESSV